MSFTLKIIKIEICISLINYFIFYEQDKMILYIFLTTPLLLWFYFVIELAFNWMVFNQIKLLLTKIYEYINNLQHSTKVWLVFMCIMICVWNIQDIIYVLDKIINVILFTPTIQFNNTFFNKYHI